MSYEAEKKCKCESKKKPHDVCSFVVDQAEIDGKEVDSIAVFGLIIFQCPDCKTIWAEADQ